MNKEIKIKIDGKEFNLKKSFRGLMLFEEITGKSVNDTNNSVTDILTLFYSLLKGSNVSTFNYSFDEFLDIVDTDIIEVFSAFLLNVEETKTDKKKQKEKH